MSRPLAKTLLLHLRLGKSRLKDSSSCSKSESGQEQTLRVATSYVRFREQTGRNPTESGRGA